ncbi:3-deoxy-manno-octulosonate cytidylyltransferase [Pantoea sp. Nvir]|uniref:3-deoxy-manno-octulosonate cytidylyltransferase n=1 Tax=Pantoea sp. Nvir TaxID=2576760 RepID=UPI00135A7DC6|nr:3-deoxy-manno-octulosonate cytidylyltransferase [Pantoea sp. Nvir]MXP66282.1 3-deoxy-manno-octulosonate cytidylyltransferase [Pantoea sp. Nvir]CAJ0991495.1 3-deoxy-manno-octulosonate cytidylyltransferase [Pantoea sp. Nvir]
MNFTVIIPARYASTRLPGKPLVDFAGKPMVIHVMERTRESGANRVIVATDHLDVKAAVEEAGGEVCMTCANHQSGTDRLAEVIKICRFADDEIIVNVQGDEPLIQSKIVYRVAENLESTQAGMTTLAAPIHDLEEVFDQNTVKVVIDAQGYALYFSRATIPWDRDLYATSNKIIGRGLLRHIGIYSYYAGFIRRYVSWEPCPLERIELLEQLRVLWYGEKIYVDTVETVPSIGIDTPEDLARVRALLQC